MSEIAVSVISVWICVSLMIEMLAFLVQLDGRSMSIASGRYMETLGEKRAPVILFLTT